MYILYSMCNMFVYCDMSSFNKATHSEPLFIWGIGSGRGGERRGNQSLGGLQMSFTKYGRYRTTISYCMSNMNMLNSCPTEARRNTSCLCLEFLVSGLRLNFKNSYCLIITFLSCISSKELTVAYRIFFLYPYSNSVRQVRLRKSDWLIVTQYIHGLVECLIPGIRFSLFPPGPLLSSTLSILLFILESCFQTVWQYAVTMKKNPWIFKHKPDISIKRFMCVKHCSFRIHGIDLATL